MKAKKGVLLINLGTPDSPKVSDVRKYLDEFLMDGRVIDIGTIQRNLLVRGAIVPFRSPKTAKLYNEIWDKEKGSPLLYISELQADLLRKELGSDYQVELAMRYQKPSIEEALQRLKLALVDSIQIIPLFPQYASASTGSVIEKVMKLMATWHAFPRISIINQFYDNELMIEAFADNAQEKEPEKYDHVLFSFHGLPVRQLKNVDNSGKHGCAAPSCCAQITTSNKFCYAAQCYETARLIAAKIQVNKEKYTVCFQSRLGKDPWVQPYTSDVLVDLAKKGVKRLLVLCPAFVADCLETLYEVTEEYGQEFKKLGGEHVELVPSLNDHPKWIEALKQMVLANEMESLKATY
ncbi:ferrochelatase [Olivibacter domesticus]|uniref:Ferrochelatase n=1 Tax=Olivibacter domesticus TaxID=407022 RepID=A0A1H7SRV5_OLID1|nr:ferrochelatase [Olivibacter domesticus]SEL75370.1 ferrochelatase [Olivibacter domesticus]